MNERSIWVNRISALALVAHLIMTHILWDGVRRQFPVVPLFGTNMQYPDWVGLCTFLAVLVPAGLLLRLPNKRGPILLLLAGISFAVALDLNRFQPWLYYYALLWLAALLPAAPRTQQWLIAAVYVWGGLQKMTPYFAEDNFEWFMSAFSWTKPLGQYPVLGYAVALGEALLGAGLLWPRTRRVTRYAVCAFHGFIIVALSWAGLDWNHVVIPWNLAMAVQVWILFGPEAQGKSNALSNYGKILVTTVWILPLLGFPGWAPRAVCWTMYNNTQPEASLWVSRGLVCAPLRKTWGAHAYDGKTKLLLDDWAMDELKVPAWNGRRCWVQAERYLNQCADAPDDAAVIVLKTGFWDKKFEQIDTIQIYTDR